MIVEIGGKAVNPEHVSFVEGDGPDRSLLHLITGKHVQCSLTRQQAIKAINDALIPRRIMLGQDQATGGNLAGL